MLQRERSKAAPRRRRYSHTDIFIFQKTIRTTYRPYNNHHHHADYFLPSFRDRALQSQHVGAAACEAQAGAPGLARGGGAIKDRIEILNFSIEFFTNFGNFTNFSSKFCKISGNFNEFRHFWTCSRNPDKISSKFRWEIAFFMKKSEISIEISIFNLAKLWLIFFFW